MHSRVSGQRVEEAPVRQMIDASCQRLSNLEKMASSLVDGKEAEGDADHLSPLILGQETSWSTPALVRELPLTC